MAWMHQENQFLPQVFRKLFLRRGGIQAMICLMNNGRHKNETGTLLHWLLQRHPDTPKTRAKQWILAGRVSVGGVVMRKPHQLLRDPGDTLRLLDRQATTLDCGAGWQIHPRVGLVFLDSALAIVNKGPGLISVPAAQGDLSALSILADFLSGKLKAWSRGEAGRTLPPAYRKLEPLPVHRLDQYTSGVFCIALNPTARGHLIEQLKEHTMQREYVAFVEGRAPAPKGTWRHWLKLSPDQLRQQIVPAGKATAPRPKFRKPSPILRSWPNMPSPAADKSSPNCGSDSKPAANIKSAPKPPTADCP